MGRAIKGRRQEGDALGRALLVQKAANITKRDLIGVARGAQSAQARQVRTVFYSTSTRICATRIATMVRGKVNYRLALLL